MFNRNLRNKKPVAKTTGLNEIDLSSIKNECQFEACTLIHYLDFH